MTTRFPEVAWIRTGEGTFEASPDSFCLTARIALDGETQGAWMAIINGRRLTCGAGPFGTIFENRQQACEALEQAMRDLIIKRIRRARRTLELYG